MKLCVALDMQDLDSNIRLAKELKDFNIWFKVGFRSFIRDGKKILSSIKDINDDFKIFLDLKLYDIPNTMADAAEEIADLDVDMFNIHASSGFEAMKSVMDRLTSRKKRPLVLAVTVLTSFNNDSFYRVYLEDIDKKAFIFAKESYEAKLDGVVCSVFESQGIKNVTSMDFLTLTPGVRPFGEDSNDQKRVANLKDAKNSFVDFIVVGRPIYNSSDPKKVVSKILEEI